MSSTVYSSCSKNKVFDILIKEAKRLFEYNRRGYREKEKMCLKFELKSHKSRRRMNHSMSVIKIKIRISMCIWYEIGEYDMTNWNTIMAYKDVHMK